MDGIQARQEAARLLCPGMDGIQARQEAARLLCLLTGENETMPKAPQRFLHQFSPDIRMLVATLCLTGGLFLSLQYPYPALLLFLCALILAWDALRYGTVWPAFDAFKAHQHDVLRRQLLEIRWPALLAAQPLAYYNWLQGIIDVGDGRHAAAKIHLLAAASGPIRTETDRSLIHCLLAEVAIQQGEIPVAAEHLRHAAALAPQGNVRRLIDSLQARVDSR